MSSRFMKKYIDILMEAMSFSSLHDAGNDYSPGETQIWYWKENRGHQMMQGYENLKQENRLPDPRNLNASHVLVGKIAETDPNKIFSMMQAEVWSPQNQAEDMINQLGTGHIGMDVGDIIVTGNQVLFVDKKGFINLLSGEEFNVTQ
jgi:hypothetical protein